MKHSTRSIDLNAGPGKGAARSFANVMDTFVAPARQRSSLHSLSQALSVTGGAVAAEEARSRAEKEQADNRRGMLEGLSLSMANDPALIKAGQMYPQESPAFMAGLRQTQAQAWGYETIRGWEADYQNWEGRNQNDPNGFLSWMHERLDTATKAIGSDEFAIAGALPILQQGINNMSTKHTAYTAERVKGEELEAMKGVTLGLMETHDWQADPTGQTLVQNLALQTDLRVAKGLDGTAVNQQMIDDVLSYADAFNDTRFLAALAHGHDTGTYRLTPKQMEQVDTKRLNIETELDHVARDNAAAQLKIEKEASARALNDYHTSLLTDRLAMPPQDMPPEDYKTALSIRSAYNQALNTVDPVEEAQSLATIYAVAYGPEFQKLSYNEKLAQIAPLLNDPNLVLSEGSVGSIFRVLAATNDPKSSFSNPVITKLRSNAVSAVKTLGGGVVSLGDENQIGHAFQMAYDTAMLGFDLEGKTPTEISALHRQLTKDIMIDLLEQSETRDVLRLSLQESPALARQFGLGEYLRDFYADNPDTASELTPDEWLAIDWGE